MREIDGFLAKYDAGVARQARAARRKMRRLFAGGVELVYDNYNALVFAYAPTERASDIICSIALYPRWVTLFFLHGASLRDPKGLLGGTGKTIRGVRLADATTLDDAAVLDLVARAKAATKVPFAAAKSVRTVVRSVSSKQRARQPAPVKRPRRP